MNRRQVSFLLASAMVLGGLAGCSCTRKDRVNYVPPPPGIGGCDRCAANNPLPPRYVPNTGPVPPPGAVPYAPGTTAPPGGPPAAVPFSPGSLAPPANPAALPNTGIQQNNYIAPGITQAPAPPNGVARAYLEQPEAVSSAPPPSSSGETRPAAPPQTPEPPPARDDRAASPAMPADIPQFAIVKTDIASGQEPYAGGVGWLKAHGYRTALHVRAPGEDDSVARRAYEQSGLRYLSLEVSPQTLSRARLDQFNQIVADANNLPLFVYDKDGSLAGGLWYLHFRLAERATAEKAREEAERLGFKQNLSDAHFKMWLAVQNLLDNLKS